jgi:hypothetical protein
MADIHLTCDSCHGKRFKADVLDVKFKEKSILKEDNKASTLFENYSYKYIRISAADKNGKQCVSSVFIDPAKFDLLLKNSIEFNDSTANFESIVNPKWKDLLSLEETQGVNYDKETNIVTLDKFEGKSLKFLVPNTNLTFYIDIDIQTKEGPSVPKSGVSNYNLILLIINLVLYILGILFYLKFLRKPKSTKNEPDSTVYLPNSMSSGEMGRGTEGGKKVNTHLEKKDSEQNLKIASALRTLISEELSKIPTKIDIKSLSDKLEQLKNNSENSFADIKQNIKNKNGDESIKNEIIKLKTDNETKKTKISDLELLIGNYKLENNKLQSELTIFEEKLELSTPKGIVYLGDCSAFVKPNLRFILSLFENEKVLLSYIDTVKNSHDAAILKGMVGKFYMAKPSEGIAEWMGILENIKINGMVIHSIKDDLIKEKEKSVIIDILNNKLFEGVYEKYLGALVLFFEEIRTANIVGVSSKPSIDLKAKIQEISTGANSVGCKVLYLPLFEPLSNLDYNNVNIEEDSILAANFTQYPSETVIDVISYAVNKGSDNISKSKVIAK